MKNVTVDGKIKQGISLKDSNSGYG